MRVTTSGIDNEEAQSGDAQDMVPLPAELPWLACALNSTVDLTLPDVPPDLCLKNVAVKARSSRCRRVLLDSVPCPGMV
jgi:hypothetical protein